jgi:hypothetical protein
MSYRFADSLQAGLGWNCSSNLILLTCFNVHFSQPQPTALLPPRFYGKPEAAAAVDKLLMMGMRMPETC